MTRQELENKLKIKIKIENPDSIMILMELSYRIFAWAWNETDEDIGMETRASGLINEILSSSNGQEILKKALNG